jgi:hypothetical protein
MKYNMKIYTFCQTKDTDYITTSQEQEHSNGFYICKDILLLLALIFVKHCTLTMSSIAVSLLILTQMAMSVLYTPLSY